VERRGHRPAIFEADVVAGLEPFAARELTNVGGAVSGGGLRFRFGGPWRRLLEPRTVVAVHAVVAAGLPRPSALLDDGTFKRLVGAVGHIRALHPSGAFGTFRLSGAGADSPTFRRVRERLARETGLRDVSEGGDLLLRFKRPPGPATRYELTARLSPRPLSARAWRVCDLPGALNATVASAMAGLTAPAPGDVYLNLACGSGTLLIERAALGPARRLLGCDVDPRALACAAENVAAAGRADVELHPWDAAAVPLPDACASALVADLPFGQLVGSHRTNERDYPAILAEGARLARSGARFVVITQQVNLFERCLRAAAGAWSLERTIRLDLPANAGVLKPRIYVLRRAATD
jgi:tRNA (guanine6-N2)-methyltransferase